MSEVLTRQRRIEWLPLANAVENKRASKRAKMLARLMEGPARTYELMQIGGSGFSSRLKELRETYTIKCDEDDAGALYTLEGW